MTGYLDAEDEADPYTADGSFRTGDLARLDADGTLKVIGRTKSLLVLSTGKKLSPEPIEQAIAAVAPFEGAVLAGEAKPFVAAVVFVLVLYSRLASRIESVETALDPSSSVEATTTRPLGTFR